MTDCRKNYVSFVHPNDHHHGKAYDCGYGDEEVEGRDDHLGRLTPVEDCDCDFHFVYSDENDQENDHNPGLAEIWIENTTFHGCVQATLHVPLLRP